MMRLPIADAHLHLQDERLAPHLEAIMAELRQLGIRHWVVNGTSEADWQRVSELAETTPEVLTAFGLHPWFVKERSENWEATLRNYLSSTNTRVVAVGEIGLDKWIRDHDIDDQEGVFRRQLRLASACDLPPVIHCLKAWGRLLEVLKGEPLSGSGFLLHSFAGPAELVDEFVSLGAYFSFSGYFLSEKKAPVLELYREKIPRDRLLIETDAPDMQLPESLEQYSLTDSRGDRLNHPANLISIYSALAKALDLPLETLANLVAGNFERLFRVS